MVTMTAGTGMVATGHRLELAVDAGTEEMMQKLDAVKWDMLNEWA